MDVEPASGGHDRYLRPRPTPPWGLGDAIAGMVVGLVLSNFLASIWLSASGQEELSLAGTGVSQLGLWVGLVGAPIYAARRKGSGRLAVDFGFVLRPLDVPVGLGAGLASQFVLVPVVALLLRPLLGRPDVSGPAKELADKADGVSLIGLVIFVVVFTPIAEELFFRGLLLRALQRRLGRGWAVAVSSVVFGLAHVNTVGARALLLIMATITVFGVLLAILTVRTGRMGPGIVAHAAFNGWTLLTLLALT